MSGALEIAPIYAEFECLACGRRGPWWGTPYCTTCDAMADADREALRVRTEARREEGRRAARREAALVRAGLPPRYRAAPAAPVDVPAGRWLLLHGSPGCGKTYRAARYLIRWIETGRPDPLFVGWPALLDARRRSFSGEEADPYLAAKLAPFLVIDDLGAEKPSEWTVETAFGLIDYRYNWLLPTVITTNLTPPDLEGHVGARTMSRISHAADARPMTGRDWRAA